VKHHNKKRGIRNNWIRYLLLIFLWTAIFIGDGIAEDSTSDTNTTIRIAIFQMSPEEGNFTANHATIEEAINISRERGADWFITPEMAESGYEFIEYIKPEQVPEFPSPWFYRLAAITREKNITLFIGFPERIETDYYNAVAVIDKEGNISGIHQKNVIIPGPIEGWATPGNSTPLEVDGQSVGYYICADATDQNITNTYISYNVDIFLSSAAWYPDPTMGPEQYWENITTMSDAPLVIANTLGKKGNIDFTHAESGVYQNGKEVYRVPDSTQVIAFVDWNYLTGEIIPAGEPEIV